MNKRLIAVGLVVFVPLILSACGSNNSAKNVATEKNSQEILNAEKTVQVVPKKIIRKISAENSESAKLNFADERSIPKFKSDVLENTEMQNLEAQNYYYDLSNELSAEYLNQQVDGGTYTYTTALGVTWSPEQGYLNSVKSADFSDQGYVENNDTYDAADQGYLQKFHSDSHGNQGYVEHFSGADFSGQGYLQNFPNGNFNGQGYIENFDFGGPRYEGYTEHFAGPQGDGYISN